MKFWFNMASMHYYLAGLGIAVLSAFLMLSAPSSYFRNDGWFHPGLRLARDDVEITAYYNRSAWLSEVGTPYSDKYPQEYPPLAVLFFAFPRLFTADFLVYEKIFAGMAAVLYGLLFGLTARVLGELRRPKRLLVFLILPAFLYFSFWRFDLLPSVLVMAAVYALLRKKASPHHSRTAASRHTGERISAFLSHSFLHAGRGAGARR